jgi:hypothetical protein
MPLVCAGNRKESKENLDAAFKGFSVTRKQTIGVALDLKDGSLFMIRKEGSTGSTSADDSEWTCKLESGFLPGPVVGTALFPCIRGRGGVVIRINLGLEDARVMAFKPPTVDFKPVGKEHEHQSCEQPTKLQVC